MHAAATATLPSQRLRLAAAGLLFHPLGLVGLFALLVTAAWFDQGTLVRLVGLLLCAALASMAWALLALLRLHPELRLESWRAFAGETLTLHLAVANGKPLPVAALAWELPLPPGLSPVAGENLGGGCPLLWPFTGHRWQRQLHCQRRGLYRLPPLRLGAGDLFGLYRHETELELTQMLLVYPRLYPVEALPLPALQPMGDLRARISAARDPSRIAGIRPYRPGDSPRHIHWKASARHRELQVKVFEPSVSAQLALFVAAGHFSDPGETFELALSAVGSIARHGLARHIPVGLYLNGTGADSGEAATLAPAARRFQLLRLLEILAAASNAPHESFGTFLQREGRRLAGRVTLLVLLQELTPELVPQLAMLRRGGRELLLVQTGVPATLWPPHDLPTLSLRSAEDLRQLLPLPQGAP